VLTRPFADGISPKITKRLLAGAADGFNWSEWRDKLHDMGSHYKVSKAEMKAFTLSDS
jgi:hypothetical protein